MLLRYAYWLVSEEAVEPLRLWTAVLELRALSRGRTCTASPNFDNAKLMIYIRLVIVRNTE